MRPRVVFVVNGVAGSAMDVRAQAIMSGLPADFDVHVFRRDPRKLLALVKFLARLLWLRPNIVWVVDAAYSGVVATWLAAKVIGFEWVVDTGDPITELARSLGRGRVGLALTEWLEDVALRQSSFVVVRGTRHEGLLRAGGHLNVATLQDSVDVSAIAAASGQDVRTEVRKELGLGTNLVIGLVGTLVWNPRLDTGYGWDLVEALGLLRDLPVTGLIVGDGDGVEHLWRRAAELGVEDRLVFTGRVAYERLPGLMSAMDVALSTQTNDLVGQCRTTGKLPLYLAASRFILASDVGEAALVLPEEMRVPFSGTADREYPSKIADRIRVLTANRDLLALAAGGQRIAHAYFDDARMAAKARRIVEGMLVQREGAVTHAT